MYWVERCIKGSIWASWWTRWWEFWRWHYFSHKILTTSYYWLTLFKYSHAYARKFPECQKLDGRERKSTSPPQPVIIEHLFQQWGLDVIGEINPKSSHLHKYILTTTYFFTRWTKEIPLKIINDNQVTSFLESHTITRFGVLESLFFIMPSIFILWK